jgi:hypothetical protein
VEDTAIDVDVPSSHFGEVFNHMLRIGGITSNMHISIYHPTVQNQAPHTDSSVDKSSDLHGSLGSMNALSRLRKFHSQLQTWRLEAPTYDPSACVYETAQFFDMTFQESRLWLFRAVIYALPEGQLKLRHHLSLLCYQAAQGILVSFSRIRGNNLLSCNRSLARLILISGLMIVSTIKMQASQGTKDSGAKSYSNIDVDFWLKDVGLDEAAYEPDLTACFAALDLCARNLSWFALSMPEVESYIQLFERLRAEAEIIRRTDPGHEREEINQTLSDGFVRHDGPLQELGPSTPAQFVLSSAVSEETLLEQTLEVDTRNNGCEVIGGDTLLSFSNEPWMEGIDGDISGLIWDTTMPWQWSPFTNI